MKPDKNIDKLMWEDKSLEEFLDEKPHVGGCMSGERIAFCALDNKLNIPVYFYNCTHLNVVVRDDGIIIQQAGPWMNDFRGKG